MTKTSRRRQLAVIARRGAPDRLRGAEGAHQLQGQLARLSFGLEQLAAGEAEPVSVLVFSQEALAGRYRATLEGLEIDGRIVLIYSPEGLNDTANAGGGCCCCGGNEIRNSWQAMPRSSTSWPSTCERSR